MAENNEYTARQLAKYRTKCRDCKEDLENLINIEYELVSILTKVHQQIDDLKQSIKDQEEFIEKLYRLALDE